MTIGTATDPSSGNCTISKSRIDWASVGRNHIATAYTEDVAQYWEGCEMARIWVAARAFLPLLCAVAAMLLPQTLFGAQTPSMENRNGCLVGVSCAAQSPAKSISEPPAPGAPLTLAIADSLADDRAMIEAILAMNPNVRVSPTKEDADYLIARYPDFPDILILIRNEELFGGNLDRPLLFDSSDEGIAKMYDLFATAGFPVGYRLPLVAGSISDASLADQLNLELGQIILARRLLFLRGKSQQDVGYEIVRDDCRGVEPSKICVPSQTLLIHNKSSLPQYVAIGHVDPHNMSFYLSQNLPKQFSLNPGESRTFPYVEDDQYTVIISANEPIDLDIVEISKRTAPDLPRAWNISVIQPPIGTATYGGGGGVVISLFAAPWQAQLYSTDSGTPASLRANATLGKVAWAQYEKRHRCGGSVIGLDDNKRYIVLTAAHCVAGEPFAGPVLRQNALKFRRVRLGTLDLTKGGTTYAIDSIVVHKGYVAGEHDNDIAILRIRPDSSTLSQNAKSVRPIAVATSQPTATTRVKWYGWGFMEATEGIVTRITSNNVVQRNPSQLHEGRMQLIDQKTCSKRGGYGKVTDFMLCAVTPLKSRVEVFTCQGDSGGPIVATQNGKTMQVGIVSWAVGCGAKGKPSVSVNVARYQSWIKEAKTKFVSGKSVEYSK